MTDRILTPDEVREGLALSKEISQKHAINADTFQRLCRNYLTLWDEREKLETTIGWYEAKHPND